MKRRLFFWLEALKISRNERLAITVLLAILISLMTANALIPHYQPYDEQYYARLMATFKARSEALHKKEQALLARYHPDVSQSISVTADPDTVAEDTAVVKQPSKDIRQTGAKINVNAADAKTLQTLPGIGPAYASRIIEYRTKHGPFTTYEELLKIKGIGKKRLEKLLPFIQL